MSDITTTSFSGILVNVIVDIDNNTGNCSFKYYLFNPNNPDNPVGEETSTITVNGPSVIIYNLYKAPEGMHFLGAASKTPYNGVIEQAFVNPTGSQIILEDLHVMEESASIHLIIGNSSNKLLLMSPDPQVINKGDIKCPPPGH
ncbi:DP-EP family protein [Gallaecimonas pentaromativorans]|uniref:DP-EP family protein n=1 Tax=Gallaecimonas pentaromativorans TaxID=584787 RepID=UPI003A8FFA21